jgi:hypothetical protein
MKLWNYIFYCLLAYNSGFIEKPTKNLTPFPHREGGKFEVSLYFKKRDLERGFPDTMKSQVY